VLAGWKCRRTDLFSVVILSSAFLDLVTTMSNKNAPLVLAEYEEWGNPGELQAYWRMKSYSPYDNVQKREYPAVWLSAGLHDPIVGYYESLKWGLKVRTSTTSPAPVLIRIDLGAGHSGKSGRYERLYSNAETAAFLLTQVGQPPLVEGRGEDAEQFAHSPSHGRQDG